MLMANRKDLAARVLESRNRSAAGAVADRPGALSPRGYDVPGERSEREHMRRAAAAYMAENQLTPPLPLGALLAHARKAALVAGAPERHVRFMTVLLSNELWRQTVASIPFNRRILLLPQCLRSSAECLGEMDALGLLCMECGSCDICRLQEKAESLGYVVLVAEGTTVVARLLEEGRIDAVVGIGCLSVLERAFAPMSDDAIPGIAVPLLSDGCVETAVDIDWATEAIVLRSEHFAQTRADIEALKEKVEGWFGEKAVDELLGCDDHSERIAGRWLSEHGKRWRPLLLTCVAEAIAPGALDDLLLRKLAVAVECFHKASLVHDDIEDEDRSRYGRPTLHVRYGVPIALNVGDLLIGEGYRLIAESALPAETIADMLAVAAEGHRSLCIGQGRELSWRLAGEPLSSREILDIFASKTAPAFEVALRMGALAAGSENGVQEVLRSFSRALGVAYQIKDDVEDFQGERIDPSGPVRPSLMLALACESTRPDDEAPAPCTCPDVRTKAVDLLEHYRAMAIEALQPLTNVELKSLLQRVVGRILGKSLAAPTPHPSTPAHSPTEPADGSG